MAHDTEKLRELLERVEAASGPDRVLDAEIYTAFSSATVYRYRSEPGWVDEEGAGTFQVERVTASLDASIALVERMLPGATYSIDNITGAEARIYVDGVESEFEAEAMTLPLALLSVLLAVLISQAEGADA